MTLIANKNICPGFKVANYIKPANTCINDKPPATVILEQSEGSVAGGHSFNYHSTM